jgi:hypothetical protein
MKTLPRDGKDSKRKELNGPRSGKKPITTGVALPSKYFGVAIARFLSRKVRISAATELAA